MTDRNEMKFNELVLEGIYIVRNEFADLANEWLDQVLIVCESAATWVVASRSRDEDGAQEEAWEYWTDRVGDDDLRGWEQVTEVAGALFPD